MTRSLLRPLLRSATALSSPARLPSLSVLSLALLLAGCGLMRTDYERPALPVPAQYRTPLDGATSTSAASQPQAASDTPAEIDPWWQGFGEPGLNTLVTRALAGNPGLALKSLQADRDALQAGLTGANRWPQLSASIAGAKSRSLDGGNAAIAAIGQTQTTSGTNASISYEVDLWNKLAAQRDAGNWQAAASAWDRRAAALTLSSDVASLYWRLAYLNENVRSAKDDLAAAETRVRARLADVDAARLSFYPSLTLTGSTSTTSDSLSRLLANPVGTLAATIAMPFLQIQTARFTTALARNDFAQSTVVFRSTLLTALKEVEDALSTRERTSVQYEALARAATLAQRASALSGARYRAGDIDLQTWLDAQRLARQARRNAAQSRLDQIDATLTLIKALGGSANGEV